MNVTATSTIIQVLSNPLRLHLTISQVFDKNLNLSSN